MRRKIIYIPILLSLLSAVFLGYFYYQSKKPKPPLHFLPASFAELPGWERMKSGPAWSAFQMSCKAFLKQDPTQEIGSQAIPMKAADWQAICSAAQSLSKPSDTEIKAFFERWLSPVLFYDSRALSGLFTGYYLPEFLGSPKQTRHFSVPLYAVPKDLVTANLGDFDPELRHHSKLVGRMLHRRMVPYYTRKEIVQGAIRSKAKVLAWIHNAVDRQFLEIEGSGAVRFPNGKSLFLGYAAQNGAPYTSIAAILIRQGLMTRDNASMQRIRDYFEQHPKQINPVLNQNRSFVFFEKLKRAEAYGSQGVPLTPGYSLAVDRKWIPMGTPIWLSTSRPSMDLSQELPFQRLMMAQDTGGAIKGPVRGDVFWGAGEKATQVAGHMKNSGFYWLLLPKAIAATLPERNLGDLK